MIFLLGLLVLGPACKGGSSSPPVPRVTRIAIAGVGEESEHAADPRVTRLMDAAARGLGRAGVAVQLQPAAAQPADFVLRLQLQVQTSALSEPGAAAGQAGSGVRLRALCAAIWMWMRECSTPRAVSARSSSSMAARVPDATESAGALLTASARPSPSNGTSSAAGNCTASIAPASTRSNRRPRKQTRPSASASEKTPARHAAVFSPML